MKSSNFILAIIASLCLVGCGNNANNSTNSNSNSQQCDMTYHHDEYSHWHECDGERVDEDVHKIVIEVVTPATYEAEGLERHTCEVCGYSYESPIPQLMHTYSTDWSHNETHHWHACLDEGYEDLKEEYGEHQIVRSEETLEYSCYCGYKTGQRDYRMTMTLPEHFKRNDPYNPKPDWAQQFVNDDNSLAFAFVTYELEGPSDRIYINPDTAADYENKIPYNTATWALHMYVYITILEAKDTHVMKGSILSNFDVECGGVRYFINTVKNSTWYDGTTRRCLGLVLDTVIEE